MTFSGHSTASAGPVRASRREEAGYARAAAPGRASSLTGTAPMSDMAVVRTRAAREAFDAGHLSAADFEALRRAYELLGQRDAAGLPPFTLTY
jgi:hypothetical protein